MKILLVAVFMLLASSFHINSIGIKISRSYSIDSLGACQGASYLNGKVYLYGDREVGMIREYRVKKDALVFLNKEYRLTEKGQDIINHPTGIAYHKTDPVFIGNSIRLNAEGSLWKAVIYCVNWEGLLKTGTLDGNILNTIEDDTCIQGTRPEYVKYNNKWYVATADYGGKNNEVRLYDPQLLKYARKTSEKGVLVKKFTCSPWVQNVHWVAEKGILVLIQNQVEGRRWRFTFIDLKKSIEAGKQQVLKVTDIDRSDELEGFCFLNSLSRGVAVTSSQINNVNLMDVKF